MDRTDIRALEAVVGRANVSRAPEDLVCYAGDATRTVGRPDAVVRADGVAQIQRLMRFANAYRIPVYPRGAGTGLTGGAVPVQGGVVLDLAMMNRILDINTDNLTATCQPGVVPAALQAAVEKHGLFYPPDPASNDTSTIGGNVAENAGGLRAVKYGVTRDYVLRLEVVLPTGVLITCGAETHKNVTGYDLTRLMIGSEGTLGIITEIVVRLIPAPEHVATVLCQFSDLEAAAATVSAIVAVPIVPRALELIDGACIRLIQDVSDVGLADGCGAILLVEVDGPRESVDRDVRRAEAVAREQGAIAADRAETAADRDRLWTVRRSISPALVAACPNRVNEDVCVPRDRLVDLCRRIGEISDRHGIEIANFGHAGDGNVHVNILPPNSDPATMHLAHEMAGEVFRATIDLGGTLSGEHGIGTTKADFLGLELAPEVIELERGIKRLFDPNNVLNPGKIFPAAVAAEAGGA